MLLQEQKGNPVLTAKSASGISQRRRFFSLSGSFHWQLLVVSPRVEPELSRIVMKDISCSWSERFRDAFRIIGPPQSSTIRCLQHAGGSVV